ncbi:hypothetical protein [Streptomyces sp. NPDC020951]|uniref:hypothetical protein n=1 Tax=Streptomyces sp. NPDC020951 TaxID=3365104 RepID=UPI0037BAA28C
MHPHTPVLRNHLRKANAESVVRDCGLRWTILQPSTFSRVALLMHGHLGNPRVLEMLLGLARLPEC